MDLFWVSGEIEDWAELMTDLNRTGTSGHNYEQWVSGEMIGLYSCLWRLLVALDLCCFFSIFLHRYSNKNTNNNAVIRTTDFGGTDG